MNRNELIEEVAKVLKTRKDAEAAIECILKTITNTLAKKEDIQIIGFGRFTTKDNAARTGRNPKTGEAIEIPAKTVPKFVPGAALKKAVK